MTKDFKKLSGLREEFALPYGVETGSLNVSSCIFLRISLRIFLLNMYLLTQSSHNLGKRFRPRAQIVYQILLTLRLSGPEAFTKSTC